MYGKEAWLLFYLKKIDLLNDFVFVEVCTDYVYIYMYENHLSIVAVVGVGCSTDEIVTHVLLQRPYVLYVRKTWKQKKC